MICAMPISRQQDGHAESSGNVDSCPPCFAMWTWHEIFLFITRQLFPLPAGFPKNVGIASIVSCSRDNEQEVGKAIEIDQDQ